MKETGVMIISVPMSKNVFNVFKRDGMPGHFTKEYDLNRLKEDLEKSNFKLIELRGCGDVPTSVSQSTLCVSQIFWRYLCEENCGNAGCNRKTFHLHRIFNNSIMQIKIITI